MADRCENCTEKCPQAEMAHQVALGRMHVTKEFAALLKKVESGVLVEVVRCKDCKWWKDDMCTNVNGANCLVMNGDWFCCSGERRTK